GKIIAMDARTSDAVALALRFKCPIFTTDEIVAKAGIILDFDSEGKKQESDSNDILTVKDEVNESEDFSSLSLDELNAILEKAVNNEDYETASRIRDEINRRK
ncbi:MAG: bifunctional nuclease domain-containing protein, partial [Bacteroidota bacterium]